MRPSEMVGKEFIHERYGRCIVNSVPKKSKVMVQITIIDRGAGWNDIKDTYVGVRKWYPNPDAGEGAKSMNWSRQENRMYGQTFLCRKDELKQS